VRSVHGQENDFEFIPVDGKNGNYRYPVEGSFVYEFPSICNHCGVMAA